MQEKKKSSLVLGILSIIFGFFIPLVGLILGIIGQVLANSHQKESKLDYKTEKILGIVGIVISVIVWILNVMVLMNGVGQ